MFFNAPANSTPADLYPTLGPLSKSLTHEEQQTLLAAEHIPLAMAGRITALLRQASPRLAPRP